MLTSGALVSYLRLWSFKHLVNFKLNIPERLKSYSNGVYKIRIKKYENVSAAQRDEEDVNRN